MKYKYISCILLLVSAELQAHLPLLHYQAPLGDERWRMNGNRLRCGLSLNIPNYGTAYFEQFAAKQPHFIMTKSQQSQSSRKAVISAAPPQWKPADNGRFITRATIRPGRYALFVSRNNALRMLTSLAEGYKARVSYRSELGYKVKLDLSPVNFQKAYSKYMQCVGRLLPFDFEDVRDTTIYYGEGDVALSDKGKQLLNQIRTYVLADRKVQKIYIAGFTDSKGRHGYNNAVSELRAKAVFDYLVMRGVPEDLIAVTWYGQSKPVADNDTFFGRAKNRRVEIKISR